MMSNSQLELEQHRMFLKEVTKFPDAVFLQDYYLKAIDALQHSPEEADRQLAQERMTSVPKKSGAAKLEVVPLESRYIHRIWVAGDVSGNREFQEGMFTQPTAKMWANLLWVYESPVNSGNLMELQGRQVVVEGKMTALQHTLIKINFRETMGRWQERPEWITRYLEYLEAMLEKKAYVAMGDIMRLILLWFMGGVYIDVKIKFNESAPKFFKDPKVAQDRLMCVDAGRIENWAMMSHAGCDMAKNILELGLNRLPSLKKISQMPVNWSHSSGKYSKAHAELHESYSVWPILQAKYGEQVVRFNEIDPPLELTNPRELNSWQDDDGVAFDWET